LVTKTKVRIEDPEVVNKSYPSFWKQVGLAGISQESYTPGIL